MHITEPMWTFLMALTRILMKVEEIDGSVPQSKVLDCVCSEQMICILSSNVISDKLHNEESEILLKEICHSFVGTWGKAVAERRKNAIQGLSKDKLALRHRLAPH